MTDDAGASTAEVRELAALLENLSPDGLAVLVAVVRRIEEVRLMDGEISALRALSRVQKVLQDD